MNDNKMGASSREVGETKEVKNNFIYGCFHSTSFYIDEVALWICDQCGYLMNEKEKINREGGRVRIATI